METHYQEWVERQAIDAEDYQLLIENEDVFSNSTSYRFFVLGKSLNEFSKKMSKAFQQFNKTK